ncbi:MAG: T9SS C-terminal target domain-containing protein [Chitinophagia bacterium]|nr:T9SS C-terminal target domain-containing protein [Chitinophagia bacterium]
MRILFIIFFFFSSLVGFSQVKRVMLGENVKRTSIYPNPGRSFIQIQFKQTTNPPSILVVYNFVGKKQLELINPGSNVYIDLADFRRGLYIFQFKDKNGQIIDSGKFQVEK